MSAYCESAPSFPFEAAEEAAEAEVVEEAQGERGLSCQHTSARTCLLLESYAC